MCRRRGPSFTLPPSSEGASRPWTSHRADAGPSLGAMLFKSNKDPPGLTWKAAGGSEGSRLTRVSGFPCSWPLQAPQTKEPTYYWSIVASSLCERTPPAEAWRSEWSWATRRRAC